MLIGAMMGALTGGFVVDSIGRWRSIVVTAVLFILSSLLISGAEELPTLLTGRFFVGVAVAWSAIADVTYLSELAPEEWKGAVVSANEHSMPLRSYTFTRS